MQAVLFNITNQVKKLGHRLSLMLAVITCVVFAATSSQATELEIKIVEKGQGVVAEKGMMVSVHYQGRLTDGTVFDDSNKRGEPISFTLGSGQVIPGWEQGIEGMTVGEKRVLTIPPELGYGEAGAGDVIPPNATLVFDVELVAARIAPTLGEASIEDIKKAQEDGTIIIDIRNESEWNTTGLIPNAIPITAFDATGGLHKDFQEKFFALLPEKETPFILYCHSAGRSNALGQAMVQQLGYSNVSHLDGGIVSWTEAGEATVPFGE